MKLRTRARYSMRMMMAIAKLSSDGKNAGLGEVSRHCNLSRKYLEQLIPALRNASLVKAASGRGGGYRLAKNASKIKVGDIIQAAIGPIAVTECVADADSCLHADFCKCRGLWELINYRIVQVLDEFSLADVMAEGFSARVRKEIGN